MPTGSSLVSRLKALTPSQLALVALGSLALAGVGTAAAASLFDGPDVRDQAFTGTDQDFAPGKKTEGEEDPYRVRSQKPQAAQGAASGQPAAKGAAKGSRNAPTTTNPAVGNGAAPAPASGNGASGSGGPDGDAGSAGPQGDTGSAGPAPTADDGNGTGATGPNGDTGSGGPKSPADAPPASGGAPAPGTPATPRPAAPAALVVKDASGATAGTLLSAPTGDWLTFSYKDRVYTANARTGALDLPAVDTSYTTDNCTGTPYASISRAANSVLRSINPSETGIYEFGQPRSVDVRSIWQVAQGGAPDMCLQYVYTNGELAPLRELPASDRPPALTGPLKAVAAG